jgi:Ca2+-binding RTX toxin-like protein
LDDDNIAFNNNEQISYGGNVLVDLAGVTKANYTHTGSGTFSWDGTNVTGAQVIKAAASESTTGGITGGAGNDSLTGNEGAQTITGNAGNDTISGLGGNDSLVGGDGNDNIASGDGADTVSGGLGTDGINISGASAADVIQISAGAVGTATDNESEDIAGTSATVVDDRGEDTITGFDAGNDTIHVTATNVLAFDHTANLAVSAPANAGISTTTTGTLNSFVKNTLFVSLDADTDYDDDDDVVVTFADFSLNGVDQLAASATDYLTVADVSGRIQYNLTGTAAANVIVAGDLADTITGGGAADTVTLGTGADRFYYTFTAKASLATESGAAAGTDNDFAAGTIGDSITGFVSGTDKIYFATAALDNGTESQTLKVITNGGTIANNDVFVRVSTDAANAEMGTAIALLNGLITATIAQTENIVVAIETTTDTYLYYVEQASTADTIAAADTTLIAKLVGVTAIADGDLVFA